MASKRGRIRRVKHCQIVFLVTLSTSIALAEDFKTVTGKEYKDVTITRVERDGIVLRSKTGISKVYFTELPKDVQEKFHPAQPMPSPTQPIKVEPKQGERSPAQGGGKVVVVGQRSGSLKIYLTGIVLLLLVVLLIIRSRF